MCTAHTRTANSMLRPTNSLPRSATNARSNIEPPLFFPQMLKVAPHCAVQLLRSSHADQQQLAAAITNEAPTECKESFEEKLLLFTVAPVIMPLHKRLCK